MKTNSKILSLAVIATILLNSCATLGGGSVNNGSLIGSNSSSSSSSSTLGSSSSKSSDVLSSLLSGLIGDNVKLTEKTLIGTWNYQAPDCRFESENYLAKAGGAVAATTVENKLASIYSSMGIKQGNCSFTFKEDKTCTVKMGVMSFSGTYTLNSSTNELNIVSNTGLIKLNGKAYYDLGGITLLFDAKKLLSLAQTIGSFAGGLNSTLGTLTSLLNQYDGMMVGMTLKK